MNNEVKFTYPAYYKYSNYLLSAFISIVLGIQGVLWVTTAIQLIWNGSNTRVALNMIIIIFIMLIAIITVGSFWQEFTITSQGINFRFFYFWSKFVPWNEITQIKKSYIPWGRYHVIITNELTIFHRVIGVIYGPTHFPAFIFNDRLIEYEEAIAFVK